MNKSQEIIVELKKRGMSYAAIGAAIGSSRESVSRIAHGQQSGDRSLLKLIKLANTAGVRVTVPYVPTKNNAPHKPDIPPLTQEQLEYEHKLDEYEKWQPYAPVAASISQTVDGVRGKVVERILPPNYSIVKRHPLEEKARVVESVPRPRRPRRQRKVRQRTHYTSYAPIDLLAFGVVLLFDKNVQTIAPPTSRQIAPAQAPTITPRYQPTYQFPPTSAPANEYVTLSWPKNGAPHVSPLGHTQAMEQEPSQPRVHFGVIPTNRTSPF